MGSDSRRGFVRFIALGVAALAVIATSQPRWNINHKQGGTVSLPAGQKAVRFSLTADSSHSLSLQLRFNPSFTDQAASRAALRAIVTARGLPHPPREARMTDGVEAGVFEQGQVTFREVVTLQPSHADFDVILERLGGDQELSISWDAEAETGERGDSTVPKSAFVRVVMSSPPAP